MSSYLDKTDQHWSTHSARFSGKDTGLFWLEKPEIHKYINTKVSGNPNVNWVEHTLSKHYAGALPLPRCLSLGCGEGRLERSLARLNVFQQCDAYDIAEGSVQMAEEKAKEEGFLNIAYSVADLNRLTLPLDYYDAVWIDSALHHFEALELVCQQIKQTLKPDGFLILNEYIGPSRFQFPERQKEIANLCLSLLPSKYRVIVEEGVSLELERTPLNKGVKWFVTRLIDKIRDGDLIRVIQQRIRTYQAKVSGRVLEKTTVNFPSVSDVVTDDPSEAIRSDEIVEIVQQYFEIVEKKDWGGNILQFLLAGIAGNFPDEDPEAQSLLKMLIEIEDTLLKCGEFESDFAYIIARPLKV